MAVALRLAASNFIRYSYSRLSKNRRLFFYFYTGSVLAALSRCSLLTPCDMTLLRFSLVWPCLMAVCGWAQAQKPLFADTIDYANHLYVYQLRALPAKHRYELSINQADAKKAPELVYRTEMSSQKGRPDPDHLTIRLHYAVKQVDTWRPYMEAYLEVVFEGPTRQVSQQNIGKPDEVYDPSGAGITYDFADGLPPEKQAMSLVAEYFIVQYNRELTGEKVKQSVQADQKNTAAVSSTITYADTINDGTTRLHYTMSEVKPAYFDLTIKKNTGNEETAGSQMVYSSFIQLSDMLQTPAEQLKVRILYASHHGYKWQPHPADFLEVTFDFKTKKILYQAHGKMLQLAKTKTAPSANFGVKKADFSVQKALTFSLNYWVKYYGAKCLLK
jgi:hypothetical protein